MTDGNRGTPSEAVCYREPAIVSVPVSYAVEGVPYRYELRCLITTPNIEFEGPVTAAMEFHRSVVELSYVHAPPWLTFGDGEATLSGTPPVGSCGTYEITTEAVSKRAADGLVRGKATQSFSLTVNPSGTERSRGGSDRVRRGPVTEASQTAGVTRTVAAAHPH